MPYIDPSMVLSPKGRLSQLNVLYDGGENDWSLAEFYWDGKPAVGMRWNGGTNDPHFPGMGNPQSRGNATWFVLPEDVAKATLRQVTPDAKARLKYFAW